MKIKREDFEACAHKKIEEWEWDALTLVNDYHPRLKGETEDAIVTVYCIAGMEAICGMVQTAYRAKLLAMTIADFKTGEASNKDLHNFFLRTLAAGCQNVKIILYEICDKI